MPGKKTEPEVLQEETVQPEIIETAEKAIEERPGLAPQIEEPVQPYGEGESSAAEKLPEPSEPEKKSFYDLDFRALDQDLSPEQRQEWNTIYASFRSRSVMRGTIIGADPHTMTVRSAQTGQVETKRMYCAVVLCRYSFHYEDSDFKTGDTVMVVIQRYDEGKKQIFGKIVGR